MSSELSNTTPRVEIDTLDVPFQEAPREMEQGTFVTLVEISNTTPFLSL